MKANFVVLEENGSADFNPAAGREVLEKEGISVKILDVRGSTESVLRRAGKLFGEEKQAERIIRERTDLIVYTGDAAACGQKTAEFIRKHPQFAECNAVKNGRIYGAPYYCHALDLRRHEILEAWSDVLAD